MSYAICRVAKVKASGVTGIQIHDRREKMVSHTNDDIDFSRSDENIELSCGGGSVQKDDEPFKERVRERLEELDINPRKNANVMAQILITSDNAFFEKLKDYESKKKFFEDSLEFIKDKYGEKNMISAIVHFDENTPHMHVNFVPIVDDSRLSSRDLFSPQSLRELQDDFHKHITGKGYDLERGARDSKAKHLETREFKLKKNEEKLDKKELKFEQKREAIDKQIDEYYRQIEKLRKQKKKLIKRGDYLQSEFNAFEKIPKGKKALVGDKVIFTKEEADKLINTAQKFRTKNLLNTELQNDLEDAYQSEGELMQLTRYDTNSKLKNQIDELRENESKLNLKISGLESRNRELKKIIDKHHKILDKNPDLANKFNQALKILNKAANRAMGLER